MLDIFTSACLIKQVPEEEHRPDRHYFPPQLVTGWYQTLTGPVCVLTEVFVICGFRVVSWAVLSINQKHKLQPQWDQNSTKSGGTRTNTQLHSPFLILKSLN